MPPLAPSTPRQRAAWLAVATLIFAAFVVVCFRTLLRSDLTQMAPLDRDGPGALSLRGWDQRYAIWAVSRNARALLSPGQPFFEAGQCFPAAHSLALGHGVMALGALGAPVSVFTSDPVLVYNVVLFFLALSAPLVMYLLVSDWTGLPVAGIVAGLVYGFHRSKLGDPDHAYLTDTAWTVLALYFLRRAFRGGSRYGSAIGFAVGVVGQLAAGVYPATASLYVGLIVLVGLAVENGVSRRLALPALLASALVAGFGVAMYSPYFALRHAGVLVDRGRVFLPFTSLLPRGAFFPGWITLGLGLVGAVGMPGAKDDAALPSRSVRASLLVACLVASFLAIGGVLVPAASVRLQDRSGSVSELPLQPSGAYEWLAGWIPGLNIGRGPAYTYGGAHLCLSLLAGLGCAALLSYGSRSRWASKERSLLAALFLVLTTGLSVARVMPRFVVIRQRPSEADLRFFRDLAAKKNSGPMLELPVADGLAWWDRASEALLLSAYHRRPTSQCFASFATSNLPDAVGRAIPHVPDPDALASLKRLGFSTLLIHHEGPGTAYAARLRDAARKRGAGITVALTSETQTAFEIR